MLELQNIRSIEYFLCLELDNSFQYRIISSNTERWPMSCVSKSPDNDNDNR